MTESVIVLTETDVVESPAAQTEDQSAAANGASAKQEKKMQALTSVTAESSDTANVAPSGKKPKAASPKTKKQSFRRPSIAERVEQQANPTSRLAGLQKTIVLQLDYHTDIIHQYLRLNQSTMLSAYERLAALLRMLARDKDLLTHVNDWIAKNTEIAQLQITELQAQRIVIEANAGLVDIPEIKTPDSYHTTFEASHPVANKMLAIAKAVDNELVACEALYFAGVIDDNEYSKLLDQTTTIIRGSVDRIYKATKPGNREGGRFNPADLAKWIREGNRMMFSDIPHEYQHLVAVESAA